MDFEKKTFVSVTVYQDWKLPSTTSNDAISTHSSSGEICCMQISGKLTWLENENPRVQ